MLSHGHWDHAGGLTKALDLIVTAKGCKDYCQMSINELSRFKWKGRRHVETFNCKTVFTWSTFQCILCRIFISRRERCTLLFTSWNVQVVALANQSFVNQTITDFRNQQDLFQIHSRQGSWLSILQAERNHPSRLNCPASGKGSAFSSQQKSSLGMGTKEYKVSKILLVANKIISTNGKVPSPEELRMHGASPIVTRWWRKLHSSTN